MFRRYAGFREEKEFKPEVANVPEADFHVEITGSTLDEPDNPNVQFESGLTRGRRPLGPGYYVAAGNIVFPINIRAIGYVLKWALGNYKFTNGVVGTNTHEIWGKEDVKIPSFTSYIGKDHFEHVFCGTVINTLTIAIAGDWLLCTMDCLAGKSYKEDLKMISELKLFKEDLLTFVSAGVTFGGINYNCKIQNLTLVISNNINSTIGRGVGTRFPCRMPVGGRNIDISGSLHFDDDSEYKKFWNQSTGIGNKSSSSEEIIISIDSGDSGSLDLVIPQFQYTSLRANPSGREPIEQVFAGYAIVDEVKNKANETIETELLCTLENNNDDLNHDDLS